MSLDVQMREYQKKVTRPRHWSRQSQPIAPAEILVNRLQRGWQLHNIVQVQTHSYGPGRSIDIYHFTLSNGTETAQIPVQSNPVVRRLIRENRLQVTPLG
ncbi:MAG: hypothetical protein GYB66_06765 [Chloroflexi bacterium]|jgi:hypothetical protein|nr:hypothetical protein [Chloroflexota bacterium]